MGNRSWPVGTGSPCFGCSEKGVGFTAPIPAQASLKYFTPPDTYAPIHAKEGHGPSTSAIAVLSGLAGAALGAGAVTAMKLGKKGTDQDQEAGKD